MSRAALWVLLLLGLPGLGLSIYFGPDEALEMAGAPSFEPLHALISFARATLPALVGVAVIALAAAWLGTGRSGVVAGLGWIVGRRDERHAARASRALASAARAALIGGLALTVVVLTIATSQLILIYPGDELPAPAEAAQLFANGIALPLWAVLFGRCVLGSSQADAALAAGERHGRVLRGWSEVALSLFLTLLPVLLLLLTFFHVRVVR